MELCPVCSGSGEAGVMIICRRDGHGCETRRHECSLCQGTGQVTAADLWRAELGHLLREIRVHGPVDAYQTQREAGAVRGVDVAVYSRIEAGLWPAGLGFERVIGWLNETARVTG